MRGNRSMSKREFPAHFSFRCDPETARLIEACLDPELPASAAMRELFQIPMIQEALRRQAVAAALAEHLLEARRGSAHGQGPLDASPRQPQPHPAQPSLRPSSDEINSGLVVSHCGTLRAQAAEGPP